MPVAGGDERKRRTLSRLASNWGRCSCCSRWPVRLAAESRNSFSASLCSPCRACLLATWAASQLLRTSPRGNSRMSSRRQGRDRPSGRLPDIMLWHPVGVSRPDLGESGTFDRREGHATAPGGGTRGENPGVKVRAQPVYYLSCAIVRSCRRLQRRVWIVAGTQCLAPAGPDVVGAVSTGREPPRCAHQQGRPR